MPGGLKQSPRTSHQQCQLRRIVHSLPIKLDEDRSYAVRFFRPPFDTTFQENLVEHRLTGGEIPGIKRIWLSNINRLHGFLRRERRDRDAPAPIYATCFSASICSE